MEFTDDPFKDYRYEDPFNIEDPFADVTDSAGIKDPFNRPTSVAGFQTRDSFAVNSALNGLALPEKRSGRVSAPPVAYDPFRAEPKPDLSLTTTNNNEGWSAWPNDDWAADDAWAKPSAPADAWAKPSAPTDAWPHNTNKPADDWKTDNWANKSENWTADWNSDANKNLNETWPNTLPNKKEKSPKPVKYAKSLVHTIGGIGRTKNKEKKKAQLEAASRSSEALPSEETQWAWAAKESKRLEKEAEKRRLQEDAELQLALAISRQEK